jgi:hypothetical protein
VKNSLLEFRDAGSFIAGILIGLSIIVPVFAGTVVELTDWQLFLLFGAPIILLLGITLQVVSTAKARRRLRTLSMASGRHVKR